VRAFVVLALAVAVVLVSSVAQVGASAGSKSTVATVLFATPTGVTLATTPPPWPLPADAKPYIAAAGLSVLSAEQLQVHYHAHLDIIANGAPVTVPPGVGFVIEQGKTTGITVLHTHDPSGIIHIESAVNKPYSLGQFFTEWGVTLNASRVGGLGVDNAHVLQAYVNGRLLKGDPATIRLKRHQEIALWYGPPGTTPTLPKSYRFPAGL
jgi:hypothetical protein